MEPWNPEKNILLSTRIVIKIEKITFIGSISIVAIYNSK